MPPNSLVYANAIIPDPHMARVIAAIASSTPAISSPPTSAPRGPLRVIEIEDSSDEDVPARRTSAQTFSQPGSVVVIDDGEMISSFPPLPSTSTHYREYSDKDRRKMGRELSRSSRRVLAQDERARQVSTASSYADDGTIKLIANLRIDEDDGKCIYIR